MALALTCKTLYANQLPSDKMGTEERLQLLELLERDVPSLVLCHDCHQLHSWVRQEGEPVELLVPNFIDDNRGGERGQVKIIISVCRPLRASQEHDHRRHKCANNCWLHSENGRARGYAHLHWLHARLVMNRHLYGIDHGLLLSDISGIRLGSVTLADSCLNPTIQMTRESKRSSPRTLRVPLLDAISAWNGVLPRCDRSWRGAIIADELFLAANYVFHHERGDNRSLSLYLLRLFIDERAGPDLCLHHGAGQSSTDPGDGPGNCPDILSFLVERSAARPVRVGPVRSCHHCWTDFQISWQLQLSGGWSICISTWHQFGPCRSPQDVKWRAMTDSTDDDADPPRQAAGCETGAVRRRFMDHVEAGAGVAESPAKEDD